MPRWSSVEAAAHRVPSSWRARPRSAPEGASSRSPRPGAPPDRWSLALPEALVRGFPETDSGDVDETACDDVFEMASGAAVTLLGPGLLNPDHAADLLDGGMPPLKGPVVIDALGSAYITRHPEGLHHLDGRAVLTLNHDELAHCLDVDAETVQDDPVGTSADLAARTRSVLFSGTPGRFVLTPEVTATASPRAAPGWARRARVTCRQGWSRGSSRVVRIPCRPPCGCGFLHGAAGDRLAQECGHVGFLAREIAAVVPRLLTWLSS